MAGPVIPRPRARTSASTAPSKADLLTRRDFASVLHAQPHFDAHRHLYNHQRPHQAPGDAVPASRYRPSPRPWRAADQGFDYAPGAILRQVK